MVHFQQCITLISFSIIYNETFLFFHKMSSRSQATFSVSANSPSQVQQPQMMQQPQMPMMQPQMMQQPQMPMMQQPQMPMMQPQMMQQQVQPQMMQQAVQPVQQVQQPAVQQQVQQATTAATTTTTTTAAATTQLPSGEDSQFFQLSPIALTKQQTTRIKRQLRQMKDEHKKGGIMVCIPFVFYDIPEEDDDDDTILGKGK